MNPFIQTLFIMTVRLWAVVLVLELVKACTQVTNACTALGLNAGGCMDDLTLNRTIPSYDGLAAYSLNSMNVSRSLDPAVILSCANSRYVAPAFQPACQNVLQSCFAVSNGNNYWALKVCFRNVVMGYKNVGGLPSIDQATLTACQSQEPIPEIVGPCNKVVAGCRSMGIIYQPFHSQYCKNDLISNRTDSSYNFYDLVGVSNVLSKNVTELVSRNLILSCANSEYVAPTFQPACQSVFQSCLDISHGNNYWALKVCFRNVVMGFKNVGGLPSIDQATLTACQSQEPIPEIVGPCNKVVAGCRSMGIIYQPFHSQYCKNDLISNRTDSSYNFYDLVGVSNVLSKNVTELVSRNLILSCANTEYVAPTFQPSCQSVFQSCLDISHGNNYWALNVCFRNLIMGFRDNPSLPIIDPKTLAECQLQEPIPQITGFCNKVDAGCRSVGFLWPKHVSLCRSDLLRGRLTIEYPKHPFPSVNESIIEGCRLETPIDGICKTACDKINIICRKSGIAGNNDELTWGYCHLPLLQGNITVPGTSTPLPSVDPSLITNCKNEMLVKATSINPQPYYYEIGYTMFLMQNMTTAEFDEINKLMIASKASVESYDGYTAQQIYDLEVAENTKWRALSQNFTAALTSSSDDMNPASLTPLTTRVANLKALHLKLYGYWRDIFMLAFIKRWRQYSFTPAPFSRLTILSVANSGNATTRTNLLNKRIARISRDLSLLQVLTRDLNSTDNLNRTQDIQQIMNYTTELEGDLSEFTQFRDSFNSSFWNTDRVTNIALKLQPVKSLLDLWEFRMFKLVSLKKNIVNEVYYVYQELADTI